MHGFFPISYPLFFRYELLVSRSPMGHDYSSSSQEGPLEIILSQVILILFTTLEPDTLFKVPILSFTLYIPAILHKKRKDD